MAVDIFYKSYEKDFDWLYKSLSSVVKYASNINSIHIVIPASERHIFNFDMVPRLFKTSIHFVNEYGNGYLYQQWEKMRAHLYCKGEYIMYMDSDCLFTKQTDISKVVKDNKPEILYTHYSKVGDAICWKAPTERFMNMPVEYEFMRRLPLIYHRSTIETIYNLVPDLENIIMKSQSFSEFNAIGAWAHSHQSDMYNFINTDQWQYVDPACIQFWSHHRNNADVENKIKSILE